MTGTLVVVGGSIFVILGVVHALLTVVDVFRPTAFAPIDDAVRLAMRSTGVRFARGRANVWDAWLGFNISHGVGMSLVGAAAVWLGLRLAGGSGDVPRGALAILVAVAVVYLVLSARFWFRVPTASFAVATACFAAAWWSY
jgi:hypothetical protein